MSEVQAGTQQSSFHDHAHIERLVQQWGDQKGTLIMILHTIQNTYGYIPREAAVVLSRQMHIPLARIYEVLTFYHYFKITPPGQHKIALCMGTACYLKGATDVLDELKRILKVNEGETTADGHFYLETVRCLGCCGLAPVMTVDGNTHGQVTADAVAAILAKYEKEG